VCNEWGSEFWGGGGDCMCYLYALLLQQLGSRRGVEAHLNAVGWWNHSYRCTLADSLQIPGFVWCVFLGGCERIIKWVAGTYIDHQLVTYFPCPKVHHLIHNHQHTLSQLMSFIHNSAVILSYKLQRRQAFQWIDVRFFFFFFSPNFVR